MTDVDKPPASGVGVDIRKSRFARSEAFERRDYNICYSRWGESFALLRTLAGYRGTAKEAQRIGNAMLDAFGGGRYAKDATTLDALAADAATLAKGGG